MRATDIGVTRSFIIRASGTNSLHVLLYSKSRHRNKINDILDCTIRRWVPVSVANGNSRYSSLATIGRLLRPETAEIPRVEIPFQTSKGVARQRVVKIRAIQRNEHVVRSMELMIDGRRIDHSS